MNSIQKAHIKNLIELTNKDLRKNQHEYLFGFQNGLVYPSEGSLNIRVSPPLITRALKFAKAFYSACYNNGHALLIRGSDTVLVVEQIEMKLLIREKFKIVPGQGKYSSRTLEPNGTLCLRYDHLYQKEWADNRDTLEDQIEKIINWLEARSVREKQEIIEREAWSAEFERKQKERALQEQLKKDELFKYNQLLADAQRWQQATLIRNYIQYKTHGKNQDQEFLEYGQWATDKADWIDPTLNREDAILGLFKDLKM